MTEPTDYSKTLFLPQTDFPMRAGLPKKEPEIVARWQEMDLYRALREDAKGRPRYTLHDGPPYANGNIHIGHALNKTLKDFITRSHQMRGYDSNYVPGWDCHGLPIEWKIEEQYRAKGKNKDDVPINEFRAECRAFADKWISIQAEEFQRLGIVGDFKQPYTTMNFHAEARIAGELLKFAASGQLYRGSKPIMWSVVERTALAEAEIEYQEYESDAIWVKFPIKSVPAEPGTSDKSSGQLESAHVLIWTTTPWTIPANRAISFSSRVSYGIYEITEAENDFGPQPGEKIVLADNLASECFNKGKLTADRKAGVSATILAGIICAHPLAGFADGYNFDVPLLDGDHVTDEAGTGFVHTAPSHGREDFEIWMANGRNLMERKIDTAIPFTVDDGGFYTTSCPGLEGARIIDDKGKKGDANKRVIEALIGKDKLFARGRLKHDYPHSWRSKKPVIFRNTPQWFLYMDKELEGYGCEQPRSSDNDTLRTRALAAIDETRFVPETGQTRLRAMIAERPDWVLSRQRAWGVPICIFCDKDGNVLVDEAVNERIVDAFAAEGSDVWFADGAKERFLAGRDDQDQWTQVTDILDVWFDSGSSHAFTLEDREDLSWPADVYLEGSDQHRGWFHSSLLEACGTRGTAPYRTVVTHGFTMAEDGRKMSKGLNNQVFPQDIIKQSGADIIRLWVATTDYWEDQRLGKNIIQTNIDAYRKLRNTLRWMLGNLAHDNGEEMPVADMPELERLMHHRLAELSEIINTAYDNFDYKRVTKTLLDFMVIELSAFYFDIRKDALYCEPPSSPKRKAALQTVRTLFDRIVTWLAPLLPFTTDEAWIARYPDARSVHLEQFKPCPDAWLDQALAEKWRKIRRIRRVVTGALELERKEKSIGSSLEAAPTVYINDPDLMSATDGLDMAEIAITSAITLTSDAAPSAAFRLEDASDIAVEFVRAKGVKCARSWRYTDDVGADPAYPDVSARDAAALRELGI